MAASVLGQTKTAGTYTFASQPRALTQRKKYRQEVNGGAGDSENPAFYGNIMYDRRVVRGNTYAQHTLPVSAYVDPVEVQRQKETRRREISRKRAKQLSRVKSPEPVEGRKHVDMQTELYLEELSDRIEETEVECQTDAFLDRPPSPLFVPAKSGVDKETQILDGELFDFNVEVLPVLEVLVGKTMEQALLEVMEEEELSNLREQQRAHEELRNGELMEQQRLEEQERRHREEKNRRMKQQDEMVRKEKETAAKIAARAFAQSYLADLVPSVFGTLTENGYFYDPVEREVERSFLPWLMDSVDEQLTKTVNSRELLDELLQQIIAQRQEQFVELETKLEEPEASQSEAVVTVVIEEPPVLADGEDAVPVEVEAGDDDDVQIGGQEPVHESETTADTDHISEEDEKEED